MTAATLIRAARDAGVTLRLVGGRLTAIGALEVVQEWAPKLRAHKAELMEAIADKSPLDWLALDRAYQAHHWGCTTCWAAGLGYGMRCGAGSALWTAYSNTSKRGTHHDRTE